MSKILTVTFDGSVLPCKFHIPTLKTLTGCYTSATIHGQQIKRKGVQKYVGRVQEPGRIERRHSSFYIGLYGEIWVNFMEPYKHLVTELIRLIAISAPFINEVSGLCSLF